jgi:hypothetical protein
MSRKSGPGGIDLPNGIMVKTSVGKHEKKI